MTNLSYGPFLSRIQAQEQGLRHYFNGKPCRNGHVEIRGVKKWNCLECDRKQKAAERVRDPERVRATERKTAQKHSVKKAAGVRAWREANKEYVLANDRKRYERIKNDPDLLAHRNSTVRAYWAKQRKLCTERAMEMKLRGRVYQALLRADTTKKSSSAKLLGCSASQVRAHLEAQFLPGMTWENWTMDGWHVDHIRPCASFDLTDEDQQRQCFHYTNLQPLWAEDNWAKSDKWEPVAA
jgi:hypothetical protein